MKLLIAFFLFLQCPVQAIDSEKNFVIMIPSYNNKDRYEKNLDSVFSQTAQNFRVIYIDDASPDGTGALVKEYIRKRGLQNRITLIRNEKRVGALANVYRAVWLCFPHEIVVDLDGDDLFAHENVLAHLNKVYENPSVWLTYGNYICYPSNEIGGGKEIPRHIIEQNNFRLFAGGTTPTRTFYAGLFHQIKKEDLLYEGEFFKVASDLAFMFPLLEIAGEHSKFLPEIDYIYNNETPLNDHHLNSTEQRVIDAYLRSKDKYLPLQQLPGTGSHKKVYISPGAWGQLFAFDSPIFNRDGGLSAMMIV